MPCCRVDADLGFGRDEGARRKAAWVNCSIIIKVYSLLVAHPFYPILLFLGLEVVLERQGLFEGLEVQPWALEQGMLLILAIPAFYYSKLVETIPTAIQCLSVNLKVLFGLSYAILKGRLVHLVYDGIGKGLNVICQWLILEDIHTDKLRFLVYCVGYSFDNEVMEVAVLQMSHKSDLS